MEINERAISTETKNIMFLYHLLDDIVTGLNTVWITTSEETSSWFYVMVFQCQTQSQCQILSASRYNYSLIITSHCHLSECTNHCIFCIQVYSTVGGSGSVKTIAFSAFFSKVSMSYFASTIKQHQLHVTKIIHLCLLMNNDFHFNVVRLAV